jgi:hypothetical protein
MVMTEAMAVGPSGGLANGSVPEVVVDGETGFYCGLGGGAGGCHGPAGGAGSRGDAGPGPGAVSAEAMAARYERA